MTTPLSKELEMRLRATGALLTGHFQLSSGLHSEHYVQCARLLQYPEHAGWAGEALARQVNEPIDLVVGPALGGVIVAYELARALGVRAVFTERVEGEMRLRRGFEIGTGERVLVAEDVITTGGSAREAAACVAKLGAVIAGYACLVDRGGAQAMGATTHALLPLDVRAYAAAECPACQAGKPVEKPGSRPSALPGSSE